MTRETEPTPEELARSYAALLMRESAKAWNKAERCMKRDDLDGYKIAMKLFRAMEAGATALLKKS